MSRRASTYGLSSFRARPKHTRAPAKHARAPAKHTMSVYGSSICAVRSRSHRRSSRKLRQRIRLSAVDRWACVRCDRRHHLVQSGCVAARVSLRHSGTVRRDVRRERARRAKRRSSIISHRSSTRCRCQTGSSWRFWRATVNSVRVTAHRSAPGSPASGARAGRTSHSRDRCVAPNYDRGG